MNLGKVVEPRIRKGSEERMLEINLGEHAVTSSGRLRNLYAGSPGETCQRFGGFLRAQGEQNRIPLRQKCSRELDLIFGSIFPHQRQLGRFAFRGPVVRGGP